MNYWKKMAFALALVAGLCGGAWAQDWGHRDRDHDKDNHKWRDRDHDRDRDRDRWRREHDYRYRNGQWGYQNRGGYYPYYPNGTYYPNQPTWGYGSGSWGYPGTGGYPGTWGYGAGGPGYGYGSTSSYQAGYRDGMMIGRNDRMEGRKYQPAQYKAYKHGDMSYKQGFGIGYDRGFGRYAR